MVKHGVKIFLVVEYGNKLLTTIILENNIVEQVLFIMHQKINF
tara:strand:+ start:1314 stop:1442 length:129 start_codon:yes stop_codon:yes gene_type:complete